MTRVNLNIARKRTTSQAIALVFMCVVTIALLTIAVRPSTTKASTPVPPKGQAGVPLAKVLNPDGTVNTTSTTSGSFDPSGYRMAYGANGEPRFIPSDTGDENWQPVPNGTDGVINSLSLTDSPSMYAAGTFATAGGQQADDLAKWNSSTGVWTPTAGAVFNNTIYSTAISGTSLYIGGAFTTANGGVANGITAYDTTSGTFTQLGSGASDLVLAVVVNGADVYIGGGFNFVNGIEAHYIAKWSTLTQSWSPLGGGVENATWSMAMHGTDLYVGCYCTWAGNQNNHVRYLAKWDTINSTWSAVRGGVYGVTHSIVFDGSDMYVSGEFTYVDDPLVVANRIAKYNLDTDTWSTLGSGVGNNVYALAVHGNNLYVGGVFTSAGGIPAQYIAKWDTTTSTWSALGSGTSFEVEALGYRDGNLYVGGNFTTAGGQTSNRIAIWHEPGDATATPTSTATAVSTATRAATLTRTVPPSSATVTASPTTNPCPSYTFSDVPCDSTFYLSIQCLADQGVTSGYTCGGPAEPCDSENRQYYRPNNGVTRGQIAKIVSLAAGFDFDGGPTLFEDVPAGSTFYRYVQALASRGYISGYACGGTNEPCGPENLHYFRPSASASRGQVAKIVTRAAGYSDSHPDDQTFEDVPRARPGVPADPFHDYVEELASRGVISGSPCGSGPVEPCIPPYNRPYFHPAGGTTRGQITKMVSRTFFPSCPAR